MSGTKHFVSLFPACPLETHLALPNRTAGKPERVWGEQCFARPPDEDAIWQSKMKLNGVAGDAPKDHHPTCLIQHYFLNL